nr:MAG TPA: hypothetical protein [Caudoviricetes sp.]
MCKKDNFFNALLVCMIVWIFTLLIGITIMMFKHVLSSMG